MVSFAVNPCPCWTVKQGSAAAAIWTVIYSLVSIALIGWQTSVVTNCQDSFIEADMDRCSHVPSLCPCSDTMTMSRYNSIVNAALIMQVINLVLISVLLLSVGLVLIAVNANNRHWLWVFMCTMPVHVVTMIIYCIIWWAGHAKGGFIAVTVLAFLVQPVNCMSFLVVALFYRDLKQQEPKLHRTVMYHDIDPDDRELIDRRNKHQKPGIIVYQREGSPASKLMFARAHVFDDSTELSDSGYRSSPNSQKPDKNNRLSVHDYDGEMKPGSVRGSFRDGGQTESNQDGYGRTERGQSQRPGNNEATNRDAGSQNRQPGNNRDYSSADPRGGNPDRNRAMGVPDRQIPARSSGRNGGFSNNDDDFVPTSDKLALITDTPPRGSQTANATKGSDRPTNHDGRRRRRHSFSDSDSDTSMVTHGKGKLKRETSDRSRRSYRKRSMDGYHSESELSRNGSKSTHHRRIENRHRKSRHFDTDNEECHRSKSSGDLQTLAKGGKGGYQAEISIPQNIVIPQTAGKLQVNSEVNLHIQPSFQGQPRHNPAHNPQKEIIV